MGSIAQIYGAMCQRPPRVNFYGQQLWSENTLPPLKN